MVNTSNHLALLSPACCSIYQEPSNRAIKLKPAQIIANEAIRIGYKILTLKEKIISFFFTSKKILFCHLLGPDSGLFDCKERNPWTRL